MRAVLSLARADLRARWRGWLSAAILVALAGGVVLATTAGARRTETAYDRLLDASRGADANLAVSDANTVQNLGGVSDFFAAVARLPMVAVAAPTVGITAVVPSRGDAELNLKAATDSRLGRVIERPRITAGRMFDPARVGEVVADRASAAQLHLRVGSRVPLLVVPVGPPGINVAPLSRTVRVVGIGVTRDNVVPVTSSAAQPALLVTPAFLHTLTPALYTYESMFVRLDPDTSLATFRRAAQRVVHAHPETGGQLFVVDEVQQASNVDHAIAPQSVALVVFALLVGLTAVLVVGQVLVRQVFLGSADHRTAWTLGMRRSELAAIALTEVAVAVVTGAVLAVVVAIALSPLTPIGPARVAEPDPGLAIDGAILGAGALLIVVVFMLRLLPPVWRLARTSTHSEAWSPGSGVERTSRVLGLVDRAGAPVSASMGTRLAFEPGRGRTAVPVWSTLVGTTVAVAAVAAAFTFGTNLDRLVRTPRLYGQTWQVAVDVEFAQLPQRRVGTFLERRPSVSGWTFGDHTEASVAGHPVAAIASTPARGPARFPALLEGRAPRTADEVVLGSTTLARAHRRVGQTVEVGIGNGGAPRSMRVVGRAIFPFFGQGEVTPTGLGDGVAVLDRRAHPEGFNFVLVSLRPGAHGASAARLARELGTAGVCGQPCAAVTMQRPADVSNYARITATPKLLAAVLALLAIATVADLLITSIRRRRPDIAILQALGFRQRQVSAAVAWQASLVVGVAVLVGLPIGIVAGRSAWLFFGRRLGVDPDPLVPWSAILVAVPVALVLANAVAAAPVWVAARRRPGPVLRTE